MRGSLFLALLVTVAWGAEPTPLAVAQAAFEDARGDEHRARMRLIWDETVPTMPARVEVLALSGYLNHDLLLMQWRDGQVVIHAVQVDRQWFYHAQPNSRTYGTVTLPAAEFIGLWQTIQYLIGVRAEEVTPRSDSHRTQIISSSHAAYHLLTWHVGDAPAWAALPVLRGGRIVNGIRDLDELKMQVIDSLLEKRIPKSAWTADPQQATAAHWRDWWRTMLPGCRGDGTGEIGERSRLLIEDACEMLGDTGDASDAMLLESLATSLRPSQPRGQGALTAPTYWEDSLRAGIARCRERIALRLAWDSASADRMLHAPDEGTYADNDQRRWLREQFHRNDPLGYRTLLLTDLQTGTVDLVLRSIQELVAYYPGEHQVELHRLLQREEPAVVLAGAMALLGEKTTSYGWNLRPESVAVCERAVGDSMLHDALIALTRLADDPTVPIPPDLRSFTPSPRTAAIDFLGTCPPPWGWDEARIRRQLEDPREVDGRLIDHLLPRLNLPRLAQAAQPQAPPSAHDRAVLISIWRRCLVEPFTRGTIEAMEELIALRDLESLPRLKAVRDALRAGASPLPFDDGTSHAPLPWLSTYDVDALDKELAGLESPAP